MYEHFKHLERNMHAHNNYRAWQKRDRRYNALFVVLALAGYASLFAAVLS